MSLLLRVRPVNNQECSALERDMTIPTYPASELAAVLAAQRAELERDHAAFVALTWPQCEEFRLARERRYFEMQTRRVCPNHDCGAVWHTYESYRCPRCG